MAQPARAGRARGSRGGGAALASGLWRSEKPRLRFLGALGLGLLGGQIGGLGWWHGARGPDKPMACADLPAQAVRLPGLSRGVQGRAMAADLCPALTARNGQGGV